MLLSDESRILYLDARVACATKPNAPVKVCAGCIQREVIFHSYFKKIDVLIKYMNLSSANELNGQRIAIRAKTK